MQIAVWDGGSLLLTAPQAEQPLEERWALVRPLWRRLSAFWNRLITSLVASRSGDACLWAIRHVEVTVWLPLEVLPRMLRRAHLLCLHRLNT